MVKLPVDPQRVLETLKASTTAAAVPADLLIAGAARWLDTLAALVAEGHEWPARSPATAEEVALLRPAADQLVLAVLPGEEEGDFKRNLGTLQWPAGGVVAVVVGAWPEKGITWYRDNVARVAWDGSAAAPGVEKLLEAVAWAAAKRAAPLARRFPGLRPAVSRRLIRQSARRTAGLGALSNVPGLDLATVGLEQMRLVLSLAAVHDQEIGKDRALELVSVLGVGFGLRALSRRAVGWLPGVGWAVRGSVAYGSTLGLGEAAVRYFQAGAPLATSRVADLAQRFRR